MGAKPRWLSFLFLWCGLSQGPLAYGSTDGDTVTITDWQSYTPTISGSTTDPDKPTTAPMFDRAMWRRVGDSMEISYVYIHTDNADASAGSGTYLFSLPINPATRTTYAIDTTKAPSSTDAEINFVVGTASVADDTTNYSGHVWVHSSLYLAINGSNTSGMGSSTFPMTSDTLKIQFVATVPISTWGTK